MIVFPAASLTWMLIRSLLTPGIIGPFAGLAAQLVPATTPFVAVLWHHTHVTAPAATVTSRYPTMGTNPGRVADGNSHYCFGDVDPHTGATSASPPMASMAAGGVLTPEDVMMERRIAWFVALSFAAANVYYFHRWVFRYSNDGTSPTYTNTPFAWQAGKYVLLVVAACVMWSWVTWSARSNRPWWHIPYRSTARFAPILTGLTAYSLVILAQATPGMSSVRELVPMIFFVPIILLLPVAPLTTEGLTVYRNVGVALIGYHVMFTAVQVSYYLVNDRLPALAYSGSLVRFGGGLDDPNGFGVMVVLPILLTVTMWRDFRRKWLASGFLSVLLVLLFLALSFSAVAGCLAGLLALAPITRRPRLLVGVLITAGVTTMLALSSSYMRGVIRDKSKSARSRFDFGGGSRAGLTDFLGDLTVPRLLFGAPRDNVTSENSYVKVLANFGIIGLAALVILVVIAFRRSLAAAREARGRDQLTTSRLFEALAAYIVAFSVAGLGVPYFLVFPANMLFWLVAMLAALGQQIFARQSMPRASVGDAGQ